VTPDSEGPHFESLADGRARRRRSRRFADSSSEYSISAPLVEFDPLNYENLARSCVSELLRQAVGPLPPAKAFRGAGVYALYYRGTLPAYASVSSEECTKPIYVGKADPSGGRKGLQFGGTATGSELHGRLVDHATSIQAVDNLSLDDFLCRYLVVVPLWIRPVERFLIEEFRPIWNGCLDGFGLHDPGVGRSPIVSWWDAMHPGRPRSLNWKSPIQLTRSEEAASRRLEEWLASAVRAVVLEDDEDDS
jgi:hypothetical protein